MRSICILNEQAEWDRGLIAELERHGCKCTVWSLCNLNISMLRPPNQHTVYLNRYSPSSFWRGNSAAQGAAQCAVAWLEGHGCTVINGRQALELEVSKVAQALACRSVGLRFPYTEIVAGKDAVLKAAEAWGRSISRQDSPLVLKPNCGGSGNAVQHFETSAQLVADLQAGKLDGVRSPDGIMLLQQFIPSDVVYRLEFVGGRLLYAVKIRTEQGQFNHCPCEQDEAQACALGRPPKFNIDCEFPSCDTESLLVQALERMLRMYSIDIAGIEAIQDARQRWWIIDCNCCNTNYNIVAEQRAQVACGGNASIAKWLHGAATSAPPPLAPPAPLPTPHSEKQSDADATHACTHSETSTPAGS